MEDSSNTTMPPRPQGAEKLVVVCGPTAVGKTRLGIEIAGRFNGEVVNADSRYAYRGLEIGVAKPTPRERRGIEHHLIDILEPTEEMTLAVYQSMAYDAIADIVSRGRPPFLVGGTPLYINAVVEGWRIPRVPPNPAFRAALEEKARQEGVETLRARLERVDPEAAIRTGTNLRRIIRALEIYEATGLPMTEVQGKGPPPYDTLELGLGMPRELLLRRINERVDQQIAQGLVEEVRALLATGVPPDAPSMSSLGYRQLVPYLDNRSTLDEAIERIKADTHRYVRHQETWLRKNPRLLRIDVTDPGWIERAIQEVDAFLTSP